MVLLGVKGLTIAMPVGRKRSPRPIMSLYAVSLAILRMA